MPQRREWYEAQNGQQSGDPAKLAQALVTIASQQPPPRRFIAGADAIAIAEQKVQDLQQQIERLPRPVDLTCTGRCIAMRALADDRQRAQR